MILFGLVSTQTVSAIILFHPTTRAVSPFIVWLPAMSLNAFSTTTASSLEKARARILGTTVGVVCFLNNYKLIKSHYNN
jgi:hypothetical protein